MVGRETALLTESQRDYLNGESDIKKKSARERTMRARIRKRLSESIFDLSLLRSNIETRDLKESFKEPDIFNQIIDSLALILDGAAQASKYDGQLVDSDVSGEEKRNTPNEKVVQMFSEFVSDAVETVYMKNGINVENVSVEIDVTLASELPSGDVSELSIEELHKMVQMGEMDFEEFSQRLKQRKQSTE